MIPNPEYKLVDDLYSFPSFESVGLELWQVKAGAIFDNFLVTDDEELAAAARKTIDARRENEKKLEKIESDKAAAEAAAASASAEKDHDHEHDHDHDHAEHEDL